MSRPIATGGWSFDPDGERAPRAGWVPMLFTPAEVRRLLALRDRYRAGRWHEHDAAARRLRFYRWAVDRGLFDG